MKTKYGLIGDLVEIKWRDSALFLQQCNKDDEFKPEYITSIGQLIGIRDNCVVIAGDIMENGELRRVIVIPEENIL